MALASFLASWCDLGVGQCECSLVPTGLMNGRRVLDVSQWAMSSVGVQAES